METGNERLFRVLGDVGSDLIATAEQKTFSAGPWRRIWPVAACLVLAVGLTMAAAPYFMVRPETASAPAAPTADAVVEESMSEEAAVPEETMVEHAAVPEAQNEAAQTQVRPKEQLVFWDTVYYVEAKYTLDEAAELLGNVLGTVESADQEALVNANVYSKQNAETRTDYKERAVPLEIFVELEPEEGYLYCLTYYLSDEPLLEWEAVQYRWQEGRLDELAGLFVYPLEMLLYEAQLELDYNLYDSLTDLTPEQQLSVFLATLEMERRFGTRTMDLDAYLWEEGENYVIPVADIKRQLERYLRDLQWKPLLLPGYDPQRESVVLPDLFVVSKTEDLFFEVKGESCFLDTENKKLSLTVRLYSGEEQLRDRSYMIDFSSEQLVYECMHTVQAG